MPDFWPDDLELWFTRLESVFCRHNVTVSMQKFKLPNEVLTNIRDVIRGINDHTNNPYERVKDRLLVCNKTTVWQQVNKIIHHPEIRGGAPRPR